jgi:hypothetical protein
VAELERQRDGTAQRLTEIQDTAGVQAGSVQQGGPGGTSVAVGTLLARSPAFPALPWQRST